MGNLTGEEHPLLVYIYIYSRGWLADRKNRLEGILLMSTYIIISIAAWFYPATPANG
jgi:hypothetical protein